MRHAADELALAAASVISQLDMRGEQFPILLAGGMLKESAWLAARRPPAHGRSRAARDRRPADRTARGRRGAAGDCRSPRRRARAALYRLPSIHTAHLRLGYGAQAVIIERFEDDDALSSALATRVLETIVARPALVLGLPTGRTPLGLYRELRERSRGDRIDWSQVRTFNLDEFAGLDPFASEQLSRLSCRPSCSITCRSIAANIGFLNGAAPDLLAECRRYEEAIEAAGGIDLQILGIGANGHIGFNEPADGLCAHTHVAELEQESREANAQRFGGDWTNVPARALSMGMATILNAREIVLIATGAEKADAVHGMIEGLITTRLPASLLQVHPRVTVMLDRAARPESCLAVRSTRAAAARCPRRSLHGSDRRTCGGARSPSV